MATGLLSKGIKISYKTTSESSFTELPDLQEIPDLGGDTDTVETTTLADGARKYIKGIKDYGDLQFTFLYDNSSASSSYRILRGLEDANTKATYKVELPDDTSFTFTGEVATAIAGVGVNDALTFTATITLNSDIKVSNPA